MQAMRAPGVHIQHVLTESKRIFQTGVPLFLGLIRQADLDIYNELHGSKAETFVVKPTGQSADIGIARKQGYVRLPKRTGRPASDSLSEQDSYLQANIAAPTTEENVEKVALSYGAAGQPSEAVDKDEIRKLSDKPQRFTIWPQFVATYGGLQSFGFLSYAVRGFFENGGRLCYVQVMAYDGDNPMNALQAGLEIVANYDDYDLICIPDIMWLDVQRRAGNFTSDWSKTLIAMQVAVINHCDRLGDRFAILDALPAATTDQALMQGHDLSSMAAALYYPWIRVNDGPLATNGYMPPCGHVAGVFARTDRTIGVFKAPANEVLEGVVDLTVKLTDEQQGPLNDAGVNCIRGFPRRGIRIWGARTLSTDSNWTFINVRRIFITAARWIERNMNDVLFEPHTPELWGRIVRDLTDYFTGLLEQGALVGNSTSEAFYIKCDAETNPPEEREVGRVVTEIGLATTVPTEFIIIRIMHGPTGVRII